LGKAKGMGQKERLGRNGEAGRRESNKELKAEGLKAY